MPRSRSGSLDSLGRRRRRCRDPSSSSHRHRRSVSVSRARSRSASRGRRRDRHSRSRSRGRRRSRSIERRRRRRSYSRSRSPVIQYHKRRRSTSRSTLRRGSEINSGESLIEPKEQPNAMSHLSEEEQMRLLLGFGDFDSTKGKVVEENVKGVAVGTVRRDTKREYRQYMNRRGGFNRPLDKA